MIYLYVWIAAQIILEMLPISSSGHLLLLQEFFSQKYGIDFNKRMDSYQSWYYILHGITFFIVLLYFGNQWVSFFYKDATIFWRPVLWLIVTDLVTFCCYLVIKQMRIPFSLGLGFFITAIALFSTRYIHQSYAIEQWQLLHAVILGAAQGIALLPGISRLAFTTAVGYYLGYSLMDSFSLSWLILAPLMASASLKDLMQSLKSYNPAQLLNTNIVLTILISSIISWYALQMVVYFISINAFFLFGLVYVHTIIVLDGIFLVIIKAGGGLICLPYLKKQHVKIVHGLIVMK